MKLSEYLNDQLSFLESQMQEAKKLDNETMQYLVDSKSSEIQLVLNALNKGIIDELN
ncbi:hypothetical protein [Lentilactobacillus laojiaonis]|uniref:hypothetical protein n=1 Tax=Lentilactobacillus laojiaonis TaxID=2883998 RepID=UPI001D09ADEA|nr:hypothetical protein [Lentilactobacillus laojiaonis]UDM32268.1 hypothetical protein LHL71_00585 [Lentilactobacillus laojiaonis]